VLTIYEFADAVAVPSKRVTGHRSLCRQWTGTGTAPAWRAGA
jgi:hypothetical protein